MARAWKIFAGAVAFVIFTGATSLQAIWGLFFTEPFFQWAHRQIPGFPMNASSYVWIVQEIAGIAFLVVIANDFFERRKRHYPRTEEETLSTMAGVWLTKFGGIVTVTREGNQLKSKMPHGSVDHFSEGSYNAASRNVKMTTVRTDAALPVETQRYVYPETWELVDDNRILFDCPRNFLGEHEYGILTRRA